MEHSYRTEGRCFLPRAFERVHPKDSREIRLWEDVLKHAQRQLGADEILVVDAGVKITALHTAKIKRFVLRLATNFTARRNFLPKHHLGCKPKYGELVRPLPRKHKDTTPAATTPDETYSWLENRREIRAEVWRDWC